MSVGELEATAFDSTGVVGVTSAAAVAVVVVDEAEDLRKLQRRFSLGVELVGVVRSCCSGMSDGFEHLSLSLCLSFLPVKMLRSHLLVFPMCDEEEGS